MLLLASQTGLLLASCISIPELVRLIETYICAAGRDQVDYRERYAAEDARSAREWFSSATVPSVAHTHGPNNIHNAMWLQG